MPAHALLDLAQAASATRRPGGAAATTLLAAPGPILAAGLAPLPPHLAAPAT